MRLSHLPLCQEADGDDLCASFFSRDDASQGNSQGEYRRFVNCSLKSEIIWLIDWYSSSRIVPITGVFQLGWPTILTIPCIHLHVSETRKHTHLDILPYFLQHCHPSVSAAYGNVQAHCALVMFAVCYQALRKTFISAHCIIIMSC